MSDLQTSNWVLVPRRLDLDEFSYRSLYLQIWWRFKLGTSTPLRKDYDSKLGTCQDPNSWSKFSTVNLSSNTLTREDLQLRLLFKFVVKKKTNKSLRNQRQGFLQFTIWRKNGEGLHHLYVVVQSSCLHKVKYVVYERPLIFRLKTHHLRLKEDVW